ncbi:MAG TPA: LuxR C-terminal-related transcriptional regulator [Puia sp.]|nr:LuxR C-terminal-related transcriptional regulator [Puia sp.]
MDIRNSIKIGLITSAAVLVIKTLNTLLVYRYFGFDKYLAVVAAAFFLVGYVIASRKSTSTGLSPALVLAKNEKDGERIIDQLREIRYSLTNREMAIFRYISSGYTNKEIAFELNVEVSTVKSHINHLFSKIDCKNRREAIEKWDEMAKLEIFS